MGVFICVYEAVFLWGCIGHFSCARVLLIWGCIGHFSGARVLSIWESENGVYFTNGAVYLCVYEAVFVSCACGDANYRSHYFTSHDWH